MNRLLFLSGVCLVLAGCSSKEYLTGTREELIVNSTDEDMLNSVDNSPVIIDSSTLNCAYPMPFLNALHNYQPLSFSLEVKELWNSKLDFESSKSIKMTASPVVADEKVFCIDAAGIVYAFNQNTGERLWRISTTIIGKDGQIGGALAYDNGKLLVTSSFAECFSLDAATGKILWRIKLPAACKGDGITVYNGKAFVTCSNSSLQVIDINSGKILWTHSGMIADSAYIGSSGVAIDDGIVHVAYPSGEIYALLEETGAVIWDAMISKFSLTNSSHTLTHPRACPVVKDGSVYFVAANGQTIAFEARTGKLLWKNNYGGVQTPSVSGDSIFVFNSKSELVCLNRNTGRKRWSVKLTKEEDEIADWYGQLLIKDYVVMIAPSGYMIFVSVADGKIAKIIEIGDEDDGISVNPAIANEMMFIPMNCGRIVAYK